MNRFVSYIINLFDTMLSELLSATLNQPLRTPDSKEQPSSNQQLEFRQGQSYNPQQLQYAQTGARPISNSIIIQSKTAQQSNTQANQYPINKSLIVNGSGAAQSGFTSARSSKYGNKYSFKRNSVNRSVVNSSNPPVNADSGDGQGQILRLKSIIADQQAALNRIRDLVLLKRKAAECGQGVEGKNCLNALTEIYNATIISSNTTIKKLEYYNEAQGFIQNNQTLNIYPNNVAPWNPLQPSINNRPINFIKVDQQSQIKPQPQPAPIFIPNNKPQQQVNSIAFNQQILPPYPPNQPVPQPQQNQQILVNPTYPPFNQQQPKPQPQPQPQQNQQIFINVPSPAINQQRPIVIPPNQQVQPNPTPIQPNPTPIQPVPAQIIPQPKPLPQEIKPSFEQPINNIQPSRPNTNIINDYKPPAVNPVDPSYRPNSNNYYPSDPSFVLPEGQDQKPKPFNNSGDLYALQIRELRAKIESLEEEKSVLIDKLRTYERSAGFSSVNNQQTIQIYREQINNLKIQITELTELYNSSGHDEESSHLRKEVLNLNETVRQYEQQLIQAQNHIIFLENSRNAEDNTTSLEDQIKDLRENLAKYSEHIEQMDVQRQKHLQLLHHRQEENYYLVEQINKHKTYIEEIQSRVDKIQQQEHQQNGGISEEYYYNLLAEYGRKFMQTLILLEEVNRLNSKISQIREHLEKAEEYIITLQENHDEDRLKMYEDEIARLTSEYNILAAANKQKDVPSSSQVPQISEEALQEIKIREEHINQLTVEYTRLNETYTEVRDHLEKAEDYIILLQDQIKNQSPVVALNQKADTDRSSILLEENTELKALVSNLHQALDTEVHKNKSSLAEYEDMKYRYESTLREFNSKYDDVLLQRNQLIGKVSSLEQEIITVAGSIKGEDVEHLKVAMQELQSQLIESKSHLKVAEDYIEQNMKEWQEAGGLKSKHEEHALFLKKISEDLEISRTQNYHLSEQLVHFERIVAEASELKAQNQQLTIVIREKDNAGISTSLKQIDQTQQALDNYTQLYNKSLIQVRVLQDENQRLREKLGHAEQYLIKAENYIAQQDQVYSIKLKQRQGEIAQLQSHLSVAEDYILKLKSESEHSLASSRKQVQQLHVVLQNAEDHIFDLEKKFQLK